MKYQSTPKHKIDVNASSLCNFFLKNPHTPTEFPCVNVHNLFLKYRRYCKSIGHEPVFENIFISHIKRKHGFKVTKEHDLWMGYMEPAKPKREIAPIQKVVMTTVLF